MPKRLLSQEQRVSIPAEYENGINLLPYVLKREHIRRLSIKYRVSANYANNLVHKK